MGTVLSKGSQMIKALHSSLFSLVLFSFILITACADVEGENPCDGVTCSGHGACQEVAGNPRCICQQGYYADGLECLLVSCDSTTCIHGTCFEDECQCNTGYAGVNCDVCADGYHEEGLTCVPNNPCDEDNPCNPEGGTCILENGQPECQCDPGYSGDTCHDCADGYHASGDRCVADSPCNPDPCVHGSCSEVGGNAACDCETGYTGDVCDACDEGYHVEGLACVPDAADGDDDPNGDVDPDGDVTDPDPDGDVVEEEPADGDVEEEPVDGDVDDTTEEVDTDTTNACSPTPAPNNGAHNVMMWTALRYAAAIPAMQTEAAYANPNAAAMQPCASSPTKAPVIW